MRKPVILHPVLFAILPILFLYSHNISELYLAQLAAPLLIAASASLLLWGVTTLALRDKPRAAVLCTLFWLWFFAFGHLHRLVEPSAVASAASLKSGIFIAVYWSLLLVGVGVVLTRKWNLAGLSGALNILAVGLVAWHVLAVGTYEGRRALALRRMRQAGDANLVDPVRARVRPNMYYIVLDGYSRADTLREVYHYDNSAFLAGLEQRGFQVARYGKANYSVTPQSLASSLNMQYLDDVVAQVGPDASDLSPLGRMIQHNRVFAFLRQRGYRVVAFSSEFLLADMPKADVYLDGVPGLSEFHGVILETTPLSLISAARHRNPMDRPHAQRILYTFDHLADTAKLEPPIFVFAHIMAPHPPFIFDAEGRVVGPDQGSRLVATDTPLHAGGDPVKAYLDQLRFISRKATATVDAIMASAQWPTVIIIQSDHGGSARTDFTSADRTDARERFGALIACRLPGAPGVRLDDHISAVNLFRVVFNYYFRANLPLLRNECYFSTRDRPYRFIRVTARVDPDVAKPQGRAETGDGAFRGSRPPTMASGRVR